MNAAVDPYWVFKIGQIVKAPVYGGKIITTEVVDKVSCGPNEARIFLKDLNEDSKRFFDHYYVVNKDNINLFEIVSNGDWDNERNA